MVKLIKNDVFELLFLLCGIFIFITILFTKYTLLCICSTFNYPHPSTFYEYISCLQLIYICLCINCVLAQNSSIAQVQLIHLFYYSHYIYLHIYKCECTYYLYIYGHSTFLNYLLQLAQNCWECFEIVFKST